MTYNVISHINRQMGRLVAILLICTVFAASCANDEDAVFDQSAANRLNEAVSNYQQLLQSSPEGWLVNYFPDGGNYGGYAYTARFDANGSVEVRSTIADYRGVSFSGSRLTSENATTSLYQVLSEQAIVLSFDTYNPFLHVLTEPQGSTNPDGFGGDYEFVFQRVSTQQDTIVLKGKRFGGDFIMTRLNGSAEDYISKACQHQFILEAMPDTITLQSSGNTAEQIIVKANEQVNYVDSNSVMQAVPYVPTDRGFRLMKPVTTHAGRQLDEFVFNYNTNHFESTEGGITIAYDFPSPEEQVSFPIGPETRYAFMKGDAEIEYSLASVDALWTLFIGATWSSSARLTIPTCMGVRWYSSPLSIHGTFGCTWTKDEATHTMTIEATGEEFLFSQYKATSGRFVTHVCEYSPYTYSFEMAGPAVSRIRLVSQKDPSAWFLLKKI